MATEQSNESIEIITKKSGTRTLEIYDVNLDPGGIVTEFQPAGLDIITKTKTKLFSIGLIVEWDSEVDAKLEFNLRWLEEIKNRSEEFKFLIYTLDGVYNGTGFIENLNENRDDKTIALTIVGATGNLSTEEIVT